MPDILHQIDRQHRQLLLLLVALGFLLRIAGIGWDGWLQFHPDERNLVEASRALTFPGKMLPDFHAYNGLALYLPRLLVWLTPGAEPDSATLTLAARLVSVAFGTAAIWFGGLIGVRLGAGVTGVLAAALLAASAPLIQWAHFGTTESAMALAVLVLWWLALRFLAGDISPKRAVLLCGLVLGLALGFKTTAAVYALIPLTAVLLRFRSLRWRAVWMVLAGALLSGLLWLATTPSLLLATQDYLNVMRFESGVVTGTLDVFWTWQFVDARNGLFELNSSRTMLGTGVLTLAVLGLIVGLATRRNLVLPVLVCVAVYCVIVFGWHAKFVRYLAPPLPVLTIFAAVAAGAALRLQSAFVRAVTVCLLLIPLAGGFSIAASYLSADPRIAASRFIESRIIPGEVIAREPSDIGAPMFYWDAVRYLPITDPAGPAKLATLSDTMAQADWLVLNSRRHWAVLPRQGARFPEMCGYYASLQAGDFGLREIARFTRWQPLRGLVYPATSAEETLVAFDRPEVIVFRRVMPVDAAAIAAAIQNRRDNCEMVAF